MSNCAESDIYCDLPYDHNGPCVELTINELVGTIDNRSVTMGGRVIGEATYIGDGMVSVEVDDKFANTFLKGSIRDFSISKPKD